MDQIESPTRYRTAGGHPGGQLEQAEVQPNNAATTTNTNMPDWNKGCPRLAIAREREGVVFFSVFFGSDVDWRDKSQRTENE